MAVTPLKSVPSRYLQSLDDLLEISTRFFDERRVGGDAVEDAPCGDFSDFVNVSSVKEELHERSSSKGFYELSPGPHRSESSLASDGSFGGFRNEGR